MTELSTNLKERTKVFFGSLGEDRKKGERPDRFFYLQDFFKEGGWFFSLSIGFAVTSLGDSSTSFRYLGENRWSQKEMKENQGGGVRTR
jgi:hypothetical protein